MKLCNKVFYICFISLISIFISTCNKEEIEIEPDTELEKSKIIDLGSNELLPSSLAKLPYQNNKAVVFIDSLGNKLQLKISNPSLIKGIKNTLYKYNVINRRHRTLSI